MRDRKELLSIGEISRLTGAGIRALHYYERKNILEPAYVDPNTGYRYYTYDQVNYVDMISSCVDLGIPLKDLAELSHKEDLSHMHEFFIRNKEAAEKKIKAAQVMSALADKALHKMDCNRKYEIGQIYTREFPEKIYCTQPCGKSLAGMNRTKVLYEFINEARANLDLDGIDEHMVLMEYGFLRTVSPDDSRHYVFFEIPKAISAENIMAIPPGNYIFRQDKHSNIEKAHRIFGGLLADRNHYTVIEAEELMSGKSKIHEPIYELRLVNVTASNAP